MSHWAEIDSNDIVIRVLVGNNEGDEGEAFFNSLGGTWIKTSFNGRIRKNFAGIGYKYDKTLDAFIPPQCHPAGVLDENTCLWSCDDLSHSEEEPILMVTDETSVI